MLRLSGWLLGKLRRELQSHTGAPNVSAIAITSFQPCGGLAAKSAMMTGRSAAASASAAFASAAGSGAGAAGTRAAPGGGSFTLVIELRLLKSRVVAHVDRPLTAAHHDRVCAGEGVRHALDAGRLIVPFDDIADRLALNVGGMNPIDEGAALGFGQRAGRA